MDQWTERDLLVVGSGVAGLSAALAAAERGAGVRLVTGEASATGSSWWAQGGIAAAIGPGDGPALHAADTFAVGAGLNDRQAVGVLVRDGRQAVRRLVDDGVPFDGGPAGPELGLEAGHGMRRILHAGGGATGERVSAALLARALAHPRITIQPNMPVDGLRREGRRVVGVTSGGQEVVGRAVVLATGGYAGLWERTTNPPTNRGSGLYLAWMAGASLADLELVQFHPTALMVAGRPAFLLSEALRGEGARLLDAAGAPVVDPLRPRDVVARALARHYPELGPVYLSLRHLDPDFVAARFPNIAAQLAAWGLDLARDLLPVAPAAHYCMGGVRTDLAGRTDVPGLYVAGEAACTGAQGANRLASNSLLECLVFGRRAALAALTDAPDHAACWPTGPLPEGPGPTLPAGHYTRHAGAPLGGRLDRDLGVERDGPRLAALVADLPDPLLGGVPADHVIAALAARAALLRTESRGAHYRIDYPATRAVWQGRIHWRRHAPPLFEEVPDLDTHIYA